MNLLALDRLQNVTRVCFLLVINDTFSKIDCVHVTLLYLCKTFLEHCSLITFGHLENLIVTIALSLFVDIIVYLYYICDANVPRKIYAYFISNLYKHSTML